MPGLGGGTGEGGGHPPHTPPWAGASRHQGSRCRGGPGAACGSVPRPGRGRPVLGTVPGPRRHRLTSLPTPQLDAASRAWLAKRWADRHPRVHLSPSPRLSQVCGRRLLPRAEPGRAPPESWAPRPDGAGPRLSLSGHLPHAHSHTPCTLMPHTHTARPHGTGRAPSTRPAHPQPWVLPPPPGPVVAGLGPRWPERPPARPPAPLRGSGAASASPTAHAGSPFGGSSVT